MTKDVFLKSINLTGKEKLRMPKKIDHNEMLLALMIVGGHSVIGELIQKQAKAAFYQSLGVAGCVLVFRIVSGIIELIGGRTDSGQTRDPFV